MNYKKKNKMWFPIAAAVFCTVGYLYLDKIKFLTRTIPILGNLFLKQAVRNLAERYGMISGEKMLAENLNMAKVSYRNLRGETCVVYVPFMRDNARKMKDKIILLEREGMNGMVYQNITQEPGMAYLLSPFEMGGRRIKVFHSPRGWNDPDFMVNDDPLMVVEKNERLPLLFTFTEEKEPEILF